MSLTTGLALGYKTLSAATPASVSGRDAKPRSRPAGRGPGGSGKPFGPDTIAKVSGRREPSADGGQPVSREERVVKDAPPGVPCCPAGSGQTRSRTAAPGTTCWEMGLLAVEGTRGDERGLGSAAPPARTAGRARSSGKAERRALPAPGRFAGRFVDAAKYKLQVPIAYSLLTQINQ